MKIIITGAAGRMGRALIQLAHAHKDISIKSAVEATGSPALGRDAGELAGLGPIGVVITDKLQLAPKDVVIDFTAPEACLKHLALVLANKGAMVIGTTGLTNIAKIKSAAKKIPIVMAPNMSVGVNTLFKLVSTAAKILGEGFDIEIMEAHHSLKKDAPSGTAIKIAELLAEATGRNYPEDFNFHREGLTGERPKKEIGLQVLRGGDIVGEHTVYFCGAGERVELRHIATSRAPFAEGALRAALWLKGKKNGLFDMRNVLGIEPPFFKGGAEGRGDKCG